jgi:hypothetical protein
VTATVLSIIGFLFALKGSKLQRLAKTKEEKEYSMLVCGGALVITAVAFLMR